MLRSVHMEERSLPVHCMMLCQWSCSLPCQDPSSYALLMHRAGLLGMNMVAVSRVEYHILVVVGNLKVFSHRLLRLQAATNRIDSGAANVND